MNFLFLLKFINERNIYFYVNRCGFRIVEFFNEKHQDPYQEDESAGNMPTDHNLFFRFEKHL